MYTVVGSANPVKIAAAEAAFNRLFPDEEHKVRGIKVSSEISDQPFGGEELIQGAKNRANNAMQASINSCSQAESHVPDYAVGIEAGFMQISKNDYLDFQFCAIQDREGNIGIGSGAGIPFSKEIVEELLNNRETELATIMEKISGNQNIKNEEGAIGYFSKGIIDRLEVSRQGVEMALIPFLNKSHYFPESKKK